VKSAFAHRFEKGLKRLIFGFAHVFVHVRRHSSVEPQSVQKILVIRQHNQMGDMLCAAPLLKALRATYPGAHIALLARPMNSAVMIGAPYLDEVIIYDKKKFISSPFGLYHFARQLRRRRFDLAIVPSTVAMSVTSDVLAFLSRARRRVGPASLEGKKNLTGYLYHIRVPLAWSKYSDVHQTRRNLAIAAALNLEKVSPELDLGLSQDELDAGAELLGENAKQQGRLLIGFHPGAAKVPNRWDALHFAEIANRCAEILGAALVITAGPDDDDPLREMVSNVPNEYLLLKNEPVRHVAAVIAHCDLYVTNDTGMMHVSAAAGTPTLSLFGPTDPLQWAPPGSKHRFILGRGASVRAIPVEKVWSVLLRMLQLRPGQSRADESRQARSSTPALSPAEIKE
jgi:ADP-heptose:LPS heptosyltransferase